MERQTRRLKVNAALCDMRGATEEKLCQYERIEVNAAILVTTPTVQALVARHAACINAANILELPEGDDVRLITRNGRMTIGPGNPPPPGRLALVVNGMLTLEPGAEAALADCISILVNGSVRCPASVAAALQGRLSVNGSMVTYPDGAILLGSTFVLDDTFVLRARAALYYAERRIVLLDPAVDPAALRDKGVRFRTRTALLARSLAAEAAPLFDDTTELVILPDGCAFVNDDAALDRALLRRYGGKLYINGDLKVGADAAPLLEQVEFLRVNGDVWVASAAEEAFWDVDARYDALRRLPGRWLRDQAQVRVDAGLLERNPDGVQVSDCAVVEIAADVLPETIEQRLSLIDCGVVACTEAQEAAVAAVSEDVGRIGPRGAQKDLCDTDSADEDTNAIAAASYCF